MRYTGLRTRVKRLEKRLGNRKPLPTIVMGIYDNPGAEVIGLEGDNGQRVRLKPGETLAELQRRAVATLPGRFLRIAYAPRAARSDETASPATTPAKAPERAPWPSVGDAGVGAIADRDRLIRMGAIAVPPERGSGP